jgi:hypothetical protein
MNWTRSRVPTISNIAYEQYVPNMSKSISLGK